MLWRGSELNGYAIRATDGVIGDIADLLFDDSEWALRWAVVETGTWLTGRSILLPTSAFGRPDSMRREFPVKVTRDRVKDSPSLDNHAPVSRRTESQLYAHYAWAPYWGPGYAYAGAVPTAGLARGPAATARTGDPRATETSAREMSKGDPHLRSVGEVTGYYIHARDDGIGHVEEFLIEDESWKVRYLVIDTKNWWPGKMVLVSPQWIKEIRWSNRQVFVDLTREQVRNSPEYDPMTTLGRDYERRLFGHYGSTPYWA